jgi:hypothetical protein
MTEQDTFAALLSYLALFDSAEAFYKGALEHGRS